MDIQSKLAALSPEQRAAFLKKLAEKKQAAKVTSRNIPLADRANPDFPLSHEQQRVWFLSEYEPESPEYSIPQIYRITNDIDINALTQAVHNTLRDHEMLRSRYVSVQGQGRQKIISLEQCSEQFGNKYLPIVDFSQRGVEKAYQDALNEIEEDTNKAFDLSNEGVFRTRLFKLDEANYIWYVNVHHIAFDAWSHGLFIKSVTNWYCALKSHTRGPDKPEISYIDYASWQRSPEQELALKKKLDYWLKQLEAVPPLELYTDRPRPAERTYHGDTCEIEFTPKLYSQITEFCQTQQVSMYTFMLCTLRILLHKYSRQDDFAIGTLIANREHKELANILGFFTNTLAFRTHIDPSNSFIQQLSSENNTVLDAYANQDVSFEKLVDELNPQRDLSRAAIFQAMLILDNTQTTSANKSNQPSDENEITLKPLSSDNKTSKFDLTVYLSQSDSLSGFFEFNTDLFDKSTIERLARHFTLLLERLLASPDKSLKEHSLLTESEKETITHHWLSGEQLAFEEQPLHSMVEQQVTKSADEIAIIDGELAITYRELDKKANQLANQLREHGAMPGKLVAMATERNAAMIIAMLAVLKTGAGYIPIDTNYPSERVKYMLETGDVSLVITHSNLQQTLSHGATTILINEQGVLEQAALPPEHLTFDSELAITNHAYVIFTSGSTGLPKGVMLTHKTVCNFLHAMKTAPGITAGEKLLACTTICFDIAVLEIFLPLISGATVVIAQRDQVLDPTKLIELINHHDIDVMQATPSTWRMMLEMDWPGKRNMKILCGGEALPPELSESLLLKSSSFWNLYGPTEATVWCSRRRIESGDGESGAVTIGNPIENVEMWLLDDNMQLVPPGVPGELYVSGNALASGYLNRDDLTDAAFLNATLYGQARRLYRTKDLACYDRSGKITFLGRADDQVKVRGYRIELGEIETVLNSHPAVQLAVTSVHELKPGDKRIIGYYQLAPSTSIDIEDFKRFIKQTLPEYMVPSLFIELNSVPLTPNGKINRRALPKPAANDINSDVPYCAPTNEIEEKLCGLFERILTTNKVGINDDFFTLGGDSLLVIRLVSQAKLVDIELTAKQVFQHKTVKLLAHASLNTKILRQETPVIGEVGMTPAQHHFLQLNHTQPHYHSLGVFLEPRDNEFDIDAIEKSLLLVMQQHDTLRMRLTSDNETSQLISDPIPSKAPLYQIPIDETQERAFARTMNQHIYDTATSLDLSNGPLFKAMLYPSFNGEKPTLFLIGHFMLADIGSWHTIIDDFETCYRQLSRSEPVRLPQKGTSFAQWVEKLSEWGQSDEAKGQLKYWMLSERKHAAALTKDFPDGINSMASSQSIYIDFDEAQTEQLTTQVTKVTGAQIDAILLSSIVYAFMQECHSNCLMIDLLGHGREALFDDVDLSRTVGWFNTIYPAFLTYGNNKSPVAAIKDINEQLRAIPNGGIGYGVLKYLNRDQALIDHVNSVPEPQVFFNYFGHDNTADLRVLHREDGFGGYGLDKKTNRLRPLAVGVYIKQNRLMVRWEYSNNIFKEERIQRLADHCQHCLKEILNQYKLS